MIPIPGYTITGKLYESIRTIIFRGLRVSDRKPVILKSINPANPKGPDVERFEKEYQVSRRFDDPGIARCIGYERPDNRPILLFEDIRGVSLDKIDALKNIDTRVILKTASDIAAAIGRMHARGIIHNDINPSNIILNQRTGRINIIDFGLSSGIAAPIQAENNPDILEGTLPYISPEQTRRINHAVDYRTDFYSFGITLYQMLTGKLPYSGEDSLEVMHGHIAGTPAPPHELKPGLPCAVSGIVEKLMAKAPEDRYQSTYGIISDIELCIEAINNKNEIKAFIPGRKDFSEKLVIPRRLYGRKQEMNTILDIYQRVVNGATEMVLVSGDSGIGKSFMISALKKPLPWNKCCFISGKCDQFKRNLPYTAIIDAFSELTGRVLAESNEGIAHWRNKITAAIGPNGQAIIDGIPDLALIIGKQPPEKKQSAATAENRFNKGFLSFIRVFTAGSHPLVLFLDDLQWADNATLNLLRAILTEPKTPHLLVIGSFRNNTIDDNQQLPRALEEIRKSDIPITRIQLKPLDPLTINQVTADTVNADRKETMALSKIISAKTGGNPFFIKEFLKALHREEAIFFNRHTCRWQWNIDAASKMSITDNVVDLMIRKIQHLPSAVVQLLMYAACIGNRFNFRTLSLISHTGFRETANLLHQAVEADLIEPARENDKSGLFWNYDHRQGRSRLQKAEFKFMHDRVQEAVYRMFSPEEKQQVHLRTGLLMLARTPRDELGENLFNIVNHFNVAESKIHDPDEKLLLARLNLEAGQKAIRSAAHHTALGCFASALKMLPENAWDRHYELTRSIYTAYARCEYLSGRISLAESRFWFILERVRTTREKIDIYRSISRILQSQGQYEQAVKAGIAALSLLDEKIPLMPGRIHLFLVAAKIRGTLRGKHPEDLARLGQMTDQHVLTVMEVLEETLGSAMFFHSDCAMYIGLKMLSLTLKYGNSSRSPLVFCVSGAILSGYMGNYMSGCAYGRLSLTMTDGSEDRNLAGTTFFLFARSMNHWTRHAKTSLGLFDKAQRETLASGNLTLSAWASVQRVIIHIITGSNLFLVSEEIENATRLITRMGHDAIGWFCEVSSRYVSALQGGTRGISDLHGETFNEVSFIRNTAAQSVHTGIFDYYQTLKTQLYFIDGHYEKAIETANPRLDAGRGLQGQAFLPDYHFYRALCMARIYPNASRREKKKLLRRIKRIKKRFMIWADNCSDNYHHKHMLICAETSRITGKSGVAAGLYQAAIQYAMKNGFAQDEAVANECSARFFMETGNMEAAATCLANARFAYLKWGATAKATQLETVFPFLSPFAAHGSKPSAYPAIQDEGRRHSLFDWRSILKTFRSISREIDRATLIRTMIARIIENAGAQRGVLLLQREEGLFVEAESRIGWKDVRLTHSVPIAEYGDLPLSMINYTVRKCRPVILADAHTGHQFEDDPYFVNQAKKSVLCSPVLYQGKSKGIIYLENDAATAVFTQERVFVIDMLSAQAAISLENATLYKRLKESEKKYRSIFENAVEGIFQVSREGTFISVNESLAAILGYTGPEELIDSGTNVVDLFFFDENRKKLFERQLNEKGRIRDFEGKGKRRDGSDFWVSVSARAIFDEQGRIDYYEGSVVDIAERKQKEEAERQRKAAEAAARAKSIFLANMSHEIRTPLNAIIGLSELSAAEGTRGKDQVYAARINHCATALLKTIDDILHLSKFEAGRVELENIDFTLSEIMEKIDTLFMHQTSGRNLVLAFTVSKDIPQTLIGDPFRMGQVLTNLTANAFKFTAGGRITIGAKCIEHKKDRVRLRFFVSDTGTGICEKDISRLFTAYSQADKSISRRYGGTGLGLAISKGIVDLMKGRIWAKNNPDRGATFYFEVDIPFRRDPVRILDIKNTRDSAAARRIMTGSTRNDASSIRLLLVDDNAISREVMPEMLKSAGFMVDTASNGREAIRKASEKHFDAVLMDLQMPGMNGFETAAVIRRIPGNESLVIIAMSAGAMDGSRRQCVNEGMTGYIAKPVDMKQLKERLEEKLFPKTPPASLLP